VDFESTSIRTCGVLLGYNTLAIGNLGRGEKKERKAVNCEVTTFLVFFFGKYRTLNEAEPCTEKGNEPNYNG